MVDDTKNCDEVGAYLEKVCPELQGAVLVIHTKANGEISEAASAKSKEELEILRRQSNEIDTWKSPFKAIVSVLMLKEGWDVRSRLLGEACDACISVVTSARPFRSFVESI